MPWREVVHGTVLDLDTLPVKGQVRAMTTSNIVPSLQLEKLLGQVNVDVMGPVTVVDTQGHPVKGLKDAEGRPMNGEPILHARMGWLERDLASHFFKVNGARNPVLRFIGPGLHFRAPQGVHKEWIEVRIRSVEVWCD